MEFENLSDEEKKEYITQLGDYILFEQCTELFTDVEKVNFIMQFGVELGNTKLFEKYADLFSDSQKVSFIKNSNSFVKYELFAKYAELFTDMEKVRFIVESGNCILFEKYAELFTDKEKVKFIEDKENIKLFDKYYMIFSYEEKINFLKNYLHYYENRTDIYEVLKKYSNVLSKKDVEQLLLIVYPNGNARKFYEKAHYLPNMTVLEKFPIEQINKFDKRIWNKLAKYDLYYENDDVKRAFVEAALTFGIFEKDKNVNERINMLEMFAKTLPRDYVYIGNLNNDFIKSNFNILSKTHIETRYNLNYENFINNPTIHNFFDDKDSVVDAYWKFQNIYGSTITEDKFKSILATKYCTLRYAKAMETILNVAYEREEVKEYKLHFKYDFNKLYKEDKVKAMILEKRLRQFYWENERTDIMTPDKLHKIFDGTDMTYKEGFYEFFKNNLKTILEDENKQYMLSKIQRSWERISEMNLGQKITFDKCKRYFAENTYTNVETEMDLIIAKLSIQSGYSQKEYDIAKKIYEEQKKRTKSSIPSIEEKEVIRGYRYKVLRLDDPLAIFVGGITNCCQSINNAGESCMIHSAISENGRVLVVLDEHDAVVSQSWIWRNQNVLCFDNIEAIKKGKDNKKIIDKEILATVKRAANKFLEIDNWKMQEWEKSQTEELNKKIENNVITIEEYDKKIESIKKQVKAQTLSKITVGEGYTDISLSELELDDENVYPIEKVKYIADSRTQFILARTNSDIIDKNKGILTIPLYEEEENHEFLINVNTDEHMSKAEREVLDTEISNYYNEVDVLNEIGSNEEFQQDVNILKLKKFFYEENIRYEDELEK